MTHPKSPARSDLKSELNELAGDLGGIVRQQAKGLEADLRARHRGALDFVHENPLLCLLGAAALGYFVAKLSTQDRLVLVEKAGK